MRPDAFSSDTPVVSDSGIMTRRRNSGRMKLHQALIVSALSLSVFVGHGSAQESEAPAFGKGRLLKKMRDDILSIKPKFKLPSFKKPNVASAQPKLKFPAPATSKVPTPALPTANSRPAPLESAAYKHSIQTTSSKKQSLASGSGSTQYQSSSSTPRVAKSTVTAEAIESITRSAKKQSEAFGMLLETRGEDLVVTQLNPAGNASKAGVRKGDLIRKVGGVELDSMLAFNEITAVLKDGDSLEFLVDQAGRESKKLVLFGEAPDMTIREIPAPSKFAESVKRTARNAAARSASRLNQYELVSPGSTMHSVIESSDAASGAVESQAAPQNWRYNSGRRNTDQQIKAVQSAALRGETVLNVPN